MWTNTRPSIYVVFHWRSAWGLCSCPIHQLCRLQPPSDDEPYQHSPLARVDHFDEQLLGERVNWHVVSRCQVALSRGEQYAQIVAPHRAGMGCWHSTRSRRDSWAGRQLWGDSSHAWPVVCQVWYGVLALAAVIYRRLVLVCRGCVSRADPCGVRRALRVRAAGVRGSGVSASLVSGPAIHGGGGGEG